MPVHAFSLEDVRVQGWPHDTRIAAAWTDQAQDATGAPIPRRGMNRIRLRWGKIVEESLFVVSVTETAGEGEAP